MAHNKDEQKEYVSLPWFGINKLLPYLKPYRPRSEEHTSELQSPS